MNSKTSETDVRGGTRFWRLNGDCHREDGPAIEWADGSRELWVNHKRHREDGPAVENADGTREWYYKGKRLYSVSTIKEFQEAIKLLLIEEVQES